MSVSSSTALVVFILVNTLNIMSLMLDFVLIKLALPTITETAQFHLWFGIVLIIIEVCVPVSLAVHFWS